jgi:hypothetical protein
VASALKPGGWLVVEEFGRSAFDPVLAMKGDTPVPPAYTFLPELAAARGLVQCGPFLSAAMQAVGLRDIRAEGLVSRWTGDHLGRG